MTEQVFINEDAKWLHELAWRAINGTHQQGSWVLSEIDATFLLGVAQRLEGLDAQAAARGQITEYERGVQDERKRQESRSNVLGQPEREAPVENPNRVVVRKLAPSSPEFRKIMAERKRKAALELSTKPTLTIEDIGL